MNEIWLRQRELSNILALNLISWIAQYVGRSPARMLLYPIALYYLFVARSSRRASILYLRRALGAEPSWLQVSKHIHFFASTILDRVFLLSGRFDKLEIIFPSVNLPLEYSRKGKGCLLLGSHFGSFEILRTYAVERRPLPIKILMHEEHNPMIMAVFNALNPDSSKDVIQLGRIDSLLQVKEAIDAGYAVGILGDRTMGKVRSTRCNLLGDATIFPTTPVLVAAALKVPVILFFGVYLGSNRYEIRFELLADQIDLGQKTRRQDIQKWTQRYVCCLERQIKQAPYNWFNFFDFWREEACK